MVLVFTTWRCTVVRRFAIGLPAGDSDARARTSGHGSARVRSRRRTGLLVLQCTVHGRLLLGLFHVVR